MQRIKIPRGLPREGSFRFDELYIRSDE